MDAGITESAIQWYSAQQVRKPRSMVGRRENWPHLTTDWSACKAGMQGNIQFRHYPHAGKTPFPSAVLIAYQYTRVESVGRIGW